VILLENLISDVCNVDWYHYAECRYAECHLAECRGVQMASPLFRYNGANWCLIKERPQVGFNEGVGTFQGPVL
jgi:hypothetical protein